MKDIIIVGFGGHARSVADCIERTGQYNIVGYTDLYEVTPNNGYKYLGTDDVLEEIYETGICNAVIAVGQIGTDTVRHKLYARLKQIGFELPVIADPSAIIADNVVIGDGTFIGKGAVVNANTIIGKMSIINTGVLCEHDCIVGEYSHVAVASVLCGNVNVGINSFVGANATVIQGVKVGNEAIVGAGSIVLHNVNDGEKRYGVV